MADEESLRQVAQSHAPFSVWLGVVVLFAFFGVIVLAVIGPAPRGNSYEQNRAKKRLDNLKTLHEADAKALTTYAWIDKDKQLARIPIDRAMEVTVAQLAQKKPAPAGPIATPAPEAPSTSSSPAPSPAGTSSPTAGATAKPKTVQGVESANRGQPAAATNPAPAPPATQPGASATPAATSAPSGLGQPGSAPSATTAPSPPGSPLPVRGKTPGETPRTF
jgi:hypothetical protein